VDKVGSAGAAPRVRILNGQFDALTLSDTVEAVFRLIQTGQRGWLCTVNVAILMMMRRDGRLRGFVERASITVADGQPIVWGASWLGRPLPERVTGVDLVDALCERAAREGKRVYLLGGTADVVARAARRLRERSPGLLIDHADGYFGNDDAAARADRIRSARADILFVGMGVPRQEIFLEEQWDRLGVGMAIGVGGSFDVLAGVRARAPLWVQKMGMEWLFRLAQEPRRLFRRYLVTNAQFSWHLIGALAAGRPPRSPTDAVDPHGPRGS
jgi:N-acetylglucosaminyldiphosphoundecaprenol N-acetyl-beta-D-mannosaminyltransferase